MVKTPATVAADSDELTFVHDTMPGLTRRRAGRGFCYYDDSGVRVTDPGVVARLRKLAIPPAWTHVWICPDPSGHIQAVGWDARGRKQYRYHTRWREQRDEEKFERLGAFGKELPTIREVVDEELSAHKMSRTRVLAGAIALIDRTFMRVGNKRYVTENGSFGLTTLRNQHVSVSHQRISFSYRGKSGLRQRNVITDRKLATLVRRCQELPGQILFEWNDDDGGIHPIGSSDINEFLREITGGPFTAKDFRTWGASSCVAGRLAEIAPPDGERTLRRRVNEAVDCAAVLLGNTRTVCRNSYVHPAVVEAYADGRLARAYQKPRKNIDLLAAHECLLLDVI